MPVESVLLFILGVVVILVGLLLSIALHELGHLIPAKLFGVRVSQYMIGFGRTLFSVRRGETEYGVKMLPLGGYISMDGMFPPDKNGHPNQNVTTGFVQPSLEERANIIAEEHANDPDDARAFYKLAIWKRIIIMLGGPFMNLVICVVMFAIMFMGIGTQQVSTTIAEVSPCLPASISQTTCSSSDPVSPAKAGGLRAGDTVVSINGRAMTSADLLQSTLAASAGTTLHLVVRRDGHEHSLEVTPGTTRESVQSSDGKVTVTEVGFIGVALKVDQYVSQPPSVVLSTVGTQASATAGVILNLPSRIVSVWNAAFGSAPRSADTPMSIVGVGRAAGEVATMPGVPLLDKLFTVLGILGSLNMALFIFNLIPLPPLDGGHIAGALWEGIRRQFAKLFRRRDPGPVDMTKLMPVTLTVIVIFGAMSLLLMYADIVKPVNLFH